jgi:hypothetical protein
MPRVRLLTALALALDGTTVEIETTLSDHRRVPPLEPLSPAERPR